MPIIPRRFSIDEIRNQGLFDNLKKLRYEEQGGQGQGNGRASRCDLCRADRTSRSTASAASQGRIRRRAIHPTW